MFKVFYKGGNITLDTLVKYTLTISQSRELRQYGITYVLTHSLEVREIIIDLSKITILRSSSIYNDIIETGLGQVLNRDFIINDILRDV